MQPVNMKEVSFRRPPPAIGEMGAAGELMGLIPMLRNAMPGFDSDQGFTPENVEKMVDSLTSHEIEPHILTSALRFVSQRVTEDIAKGTKDSLTTVLASYNAKPAPLELWVGATTERPIILWAVSAKPITGLEIQEWDDNYEVSLDEAMTGITWTITLATYAKIAMTCHQLVEEYADEGEDIPKVFTYAVDNVTKHIYRLVQSLPISYPEVWRKSLALDRVPEIFSVMESGRLTPEKISEALRNIEYSFFAVTAAD